MMTSEDLYAEDLENDDLETFEEDDGTEANPQEEAPPSESTGETASKEVVKPKRIVRNPQPKLNAMTLKGKRGITTLDSYFDQAKYKGRDHEEEDLSVILKTYEYWCHRLFPKYTFDECISSIEKLGSKKPVQTYIKKIRLGMIHDEEGTPAVVNDDSETEENPNNQFDELFNEPTPPMPTTVEITEELQERIRLNRERAERLRQEKLRTTADSNESFSKDSTTQICTEIAETSQMEYEEDVDNIFDKIQDSNQQERSNFQEDGSLMSDSSDSSDIEKTLHPASQSDEVAGPD